MNIGTLKSNEDGIHISDDIASFSFLEGSLGRRNITIENNTFTRVRGCGPERRGTVGCDHVCTNVSCVLSHVDDTLKHVVRSIGNRAGAGSPELLHM